MIPWIKQDIDKLKTDNLYRQLREVSSTQGREIVLNGQRVLNFCSNDYLGLANDERIKTAAKNAIDREGFGAGASRLVTGNMSAHMLLEKKMSQFKKTESSLVFSSGYMANTGIVSALMGRDDIVYSDRLNHASIIDGIILSRARLERYPHNDMEALERLLKDAPQGKRKLIVTDSVFSMDGDVAPLSKLVELSRRYEACLMVDEAHGFGVLGTNGAGLVEACGLENDVDIQMGTFSKAAGCFGAYVCGSQLLREYLINHARSFIYTTAMPPVIAAACSCAVDIIQQDNDRRENLYRNVNYLRTALQKSGYNTAQSSTAIIPVILGSASEAVGLSQRLLEQDIFVQAIRPPTVPEGTARLRITVMATHTQDDLDKLINVIKSC